MMRIENRARPIAFCCTALAITLIVGCSGGPRADYGALGLVEISGTVTLDGEPLGNAGIFFYRENESYSYGITDSSGRYTAMFNTEKSGVMPGEARIEISTVKSPIPGGLSGAASDGEEGGEVEEEDPDSKPSREEKVPKCYNVDSTMTVDITASDSAMDFELKSDCTTVGPT